MRKNNYKIECLLLLLFFGSAFYSLGTEKVYLFTDQSSCVSGDTLWFRVYLYGENTPVESNIVHIELTAKSKTINQAIVKSTDNWAEGYLFVPDSLSTGIYQLIAYTHQQKYFNNSRIAAKSIAVYNRFESNLETIAIPDFSSLDEVAFNKADFGILLPKDVYKTRENINLKLHMPDSLRENLKGLLVSVRLSDPLTGKFPLMNELRIKQNRSSEKIVEKNGMLVQGTVYEPETNIPAAGALVLLTIPDTIPYFDYCVSDGYGAFQFYLKNAEGTAKMVFQVISKEDKNFQLNFGGENIFAQVQSTYSDKTLTHDEIVYTTKVIDASFYQKMFGQAMPDDVSHFSMDYEFAHPYYGKPDEVVYPHLFIDLPDFIEISRELLPGVFYRRKDDMHSIRMLDQVRLGIFDSEPLKLINGIPVFDVKILKNLGTSELKKVEMVFKQKFYGDLAFNGVLALYTKDQTLNWTENIQNLFLVDHKCIQKPMKNNSGIAVTTKQNIPDLRKVFFNQLFQDFEKPLEVTFNASDLQGEILIEVIGISNDSKLFYNTQKAIVE